MSLFLHWRNRLRLNVSKKSCSFSISQPQIKYRSFAMYPTMTPSAVNRKYVMIESSFFYFFSLSIKHLISPQIINL